MEITTTRSEEISVVLDVDKLAKSTRAELEILHSFSNKCCIYRVPKRLREINEKAYTPQAVSIGPLHWGKEELKAMEVHKRRYLQEFLEQSKVSLENIIKFIKENQTGLRNCYAETIELNAEDFVSMMLLDAAFIIMVLLKDFYIKFRNSNDRIYNRPWGIEEVGHDMCLLENQLPFFILEGLLKLSRIISHSKDCCMIKLTHSFLKSVWGSWVTEDNLEKLSSSKVDHFVDFLRIYQQPTELRGPKILKTLTTPSATELYEAGVKIKLSSGQNLLDINFDKSGTLEIPHLKIDDWSEILLRNLQAFEQCHCADNYVGDYICMIGMLVKSCKDVEMLVGNGIMSNRLHDSGEALRLLSNLGKKNLFCLNNFYFSGLVEDLNKHCRRRRHRWKAILTQQYFHNPWAVISVVAASTLLILTIIQTVCSVIQVT